MNELITKELVEATYLFCVKRISDSEAAKDLSQDILYEALRAIAANKQFVSFHSWYWQVARNKCADYISAKRSPHLPIEEARGVADDFLQPIERIIKAEDISTLKLSLSRMAAIHREILTRFYLKEQSVAQIAKELDIPEGTVKRRLFDAKQNLKERLNHMNNVGTLSYAPAEVNWFWGYQCKNASQVMISSKICAQVMVVCNKEPKTISEIADELGIATVYLEDIVEKMAGVDLLATPSKGKYQTNHCMFPRQAYMNAKACVNQAFYENGFPEKVTNKLLELQEQIKALDFYGNQFDYSYLMWLLYVVAGDVFGIIGKRHYQEKYQGKLADQAERTYRLTLEYKLADEDIDYSVYEKMKTMGWSNLHQHFETTDYGTLTFINNFECDPFPNESCDEIGDLRKGRDKWIDGNNISLLVALAENPGKELSAYEEEKAAELLKNGLLKKQEEGLVVQIPIFRGEIGAQVYEMVGKEMRALACEYADIVKDKVEKLLLPYVRKDLMSNFVYWDMQMFFQCIVELFYYGWETQLAQPQDYAKSGAGLCIVRR